MCGWRGTWGLCKWEQWQGCIYCFYLLYINLGVWVTRNMRMVQMRTIARLQSLFCWATLLSKAAFMLLPRKKSLQNWVLGQLLKFTSIFLPIWRFCWVLTSVLSKKRGGAANLLLKCSDERQNKHRSSSSSQIGPPSTNTDKTKTDLPHHHKWGHQAIIEVSTFPGWETKENNFLAEMNISGQHD